MRSCTIDSMPWAFAQQSDKQRPGLRLARLQRDARPTQRPAQAHLLPIVGAFVHEQRLARGHAAHVDRIVAPARTETAARRTAAVDRSPAPRRRAGPESSLTYAGSVTVQLKSADKCRTPRSSAIRPTRNDALVVPRGVVAAQLDLQTEQPVALDPVAEQHRQAVVDVLAVHLAVVQRIEAADQMPRRPARCRRLHEESPADTSPRKSTSASVGRLQVPRQIAIHPVAIVGRRTSARRATCRTRRAARCRTPKGRPAPPAAAGDARRRGRR